jgi:predicted TIM-barrel fold metal-dependent hydrolase
MLPRSPEAGTARSQRFDIVDALTVIGPWRDRPPGVAYDFEDLLNEHATYGITRRLTLHAEARDGVPDEGNNALTRTTFLRDDTGMIWTVLPPRHFGGRKAEAIVGDAQTAGVGMFALFPDTHGHHIAPWANRELYMAMEAARLPLLLDLGNAQGADARRRYEEIQAVASAHPRLPIVAWNAFYMDERLLIPLLDSAPNVHLGLATLFIPTFGVEQFTQRYGPGRLIFGSNWPRQSPGPLLTYVLYADVNDRVKADILGFNIRRLVEAVRWRVRGFLKAEATQPPETTPTDLAAPPAAVGEPSPDEPSPIDPASAPWLKALEDVRAGRTDHRDEDEM